MKIIKSIPSQNIYFDENIIKAGNARESAEMGVVNVFDDVEYQSVLGFGGSFTESAAYLYSLLNDEQKKSFMESYFSREKGIGYNFGRTHINSCDFSLDIYTYIDKIKSNAKEIFNTFKDEYGSVCCGTITNNGEDKSPCVDCCVFIAKKVADLWDE